MFNPKVSDFLKEKSHLTVIGLYWAGFWRLYVIVFGVTLAIGLLGALFD